MKSIIQKHKNHCFVCQQQTILEEHHIFFGSNRKLSEQYGLKVPLCYEHHRGTNGVHGKNGKQLNEKLKKIAQQRFEEIYGHDKFMEVFKKNYL